MSTFSILTHGCRVNQADSLELERALVSQGLRPDHPSRADVVVVNTCSVTASADQGARQAIRRVSRENPSARIVVTGCYATRAASELSGIPGVVRVVANPLKADLAGVVQEALGTGCAPASTSGDGPCGMEIGPGAGGRTAWTLRVQTGCEQVCSYCIIPTTRGPSRSRALDDVLAEAARAAAAGYKEVIVTGVHLGSWGRDLSPVRALALLLRALCEHHSDVLFRISSIEPMDCTPEVQRMLAHPRIAPHFHLPLQHASDRVLAAMRRPYALAQYDALVRTMADLRPDAAIGTDILVGFPGESDDDHARNLEWLARAPLTHLHVFPYSDRPGTAASQMPAKVHGAVVRQRGEQVRHLSERLHASFVARMRGQVRAALTVDDGTSAVTDNYLKVRVPAGLPRNVRVKVRIDEIAPLSGEIVEEAANRR